MAIAGRGGTSVADAGSTERIERIGIGVAYDGSLFHGVAAQPGQRTVAGVLTDALEPFGLSSRLVVAGRTDTGVHATAQVAHADLDLAKVSRHEGGVRERGAPLEAIRRALDARVGDEISIWRCLVMGASFDARRSALSRRYRYAIATGPANPLERRAEWNVPEPLDVAAMRLGADAIVGEHDFAGFCRVPRDRRDASLVRRVLEARVLTKPGNKVVVEIEANAFCHQMVRSIVGVLVAIGSGRLRASEMHARLRSRSRDGMPTLAPPAGLCLVAVRYPGEFGGTWALPIP